MSVEHIKNILQNLKPEKLEIIDQSHKHKGHAGWREGGGTHFDVLIVSSEFEGKSQLQRHKLVYKLLKKELENSIHALSIKAFTPDECKNRKGT